jgi:hypothetical protein
MKINWDEALHALVLIRIGQDLGTDSPATRAIHDAINFLASVAGSFWR